MHGTDIHSDGGGSPTCPAASGAADPLPPEQLSATEVDQDRFNAGMRLIRKRRLFFFVTILAYMPAMWAANKISPTFRSMAITFGIWVVILFITALYSAVVRCPRCGNYFHMHGMSLLYLRRCLHCQLHINEELKES